MSIFKDNYEACCKQLDEIAREMVKYDKRRLTSRKANRKWLKLKRERKVIFKEMQHWELKYLAIENVPGVRRKWRKRLFK